MKSSLKSTCLLLKGRRSVFLSYFTWRFRKIQAIKSQALFLFGYVARCLTKSLSEVSLVDVAHLYFTLRLLIHLQYVNHNLNFIKILRKFAYENIGKESHTLPSLTVWQLSYMLIVGWQLKDWFFGGKIIVTFCIGTKVCLRLYWNKNHLPLT